MDGLETSDHFEQATTGELPSLATAGLVRLTRDRQNKVHHY